MNHISQLLVILTISLLVSCNANPTKAPIVQTPETQCIAKGGQWERLTRLKGCNMIYSDAGKKCTDNSQCQAKICLTPSRDTSATQGQCPASTKKAIHGGCIGGQIRNSMYGSLSCP
ncbi:MAG: hypothetical protein KAH22_04980 [Thiotrichaceae bacterium]|nr:hypothetical protein [Thiotrichaceae bacterium]